MLDSASGRVHVSARIQVLRTKAEPFSFKCPAYTELGALIPAAARGSATTVQANGFISGDGKSADIRFRALPGNGIIGVRPSGYNSVAVTKNAGFILNIDYNH